MRHLNKPELKRLKNLQAGHYYSPQPLVEEEAFIGWVVEKTDAITRFLATLEGLIHRLFASWGEPGEPAEVEEMRDASILVRDALAATVDFEESLQFAHIPEEGEEIRTLLMNILGSSAVGLGEIPEKLDEMVSMINTDHGGTVEEPLIVRWRFPFELPKSFRKRSHRALRTYQRRIQR
ncbi:hypothetical protein DXV76_10305 [Rhodobacteraceae bacterium CCMM004]|nr:hypothetical protein DXV76_10305 [Rhodobacteraceae bacterium CCMM004]